MISLGKDTYSKYTITGDALIVQLLQNQIVLQCKVSEILV